jgi:Ca-activated chloride channel family protein
MILMMVAPKVAPVWADPGRRDAGPVQLGVELVQDKVLAGSDGLAAVSLTLAVAQVPQSDTPMVKAADLIIVLDRSGSMAGQKLHDACQAVMRLLDRLSARDRLALVIYSNGVQTLCPLARMDAGHRRRVRYAIQEIDAGGGTNLGGGLQRGIETVAFEPSGARQRKVILISDGLANQGITDPYTLGRMAANAAGRRVTVSTVGVGYDFNELLMTTIADHGEGRYYFLENPDAFAQVFERELASSRHVVASGVEIRVPLKKGLRLVHAGGYPVTVEDGVAVIRPGDLLSGQELKLFLTFKVPSDRERAIRLGAFDLTYRYNGAALHQQSREGLTLSCVADKGAVLSSIHRDAWADQVVQEDFNRLREDVAEAVRKGEKTAALGRIQKYETRHRAINEAVGSPKVAENLDQAVKSLRRQVAETFTGAPQAVAEKKKQTAKTLQYEGYQLRRDKK